MSLAGFPGVRALPALLVVSLVGCADLSTGTSLDGDDLGERSAALTGDARLARVTAIRDVSAGLGLANGPLLAGIAESETNMAHCWSEATWACKGPASPSCDGGPVIAGSADGPCSLEQGGLGMFQFDGGTYDQTLARDGEDILLLEGNISHAIDFVVERVIQDISGVVDATTAIDWLNSIPMTAGDPLTEAWASMIVCRYNGCCSEAALCQQRRAKYRDNAIEIYNTYGPDFWSTEAEPDPDPEPDPDCEPGDPSCTPGGGMDGGEIEVDGGVVGGCAAGGGAAWCTGLVGVALLVDRRRRRR
jgi:hypothetical protein